MSLNLKSKTQKYVAALMAAALGATTILGTGVSAEDLHVGVGVDAGLLDGSESDADGISMDAEAVESTEAEEAAGLAEEAVTPESVAESLAGAGLMWTDATDEEPGTKIITVEKKDGSEFAEGEELLAGGLNENDLGIEDIMYIAAEAEVAAEKAGEAYTAADVENRMAEYVEFEVLKPYILGQDGEVTITDGEMLLGVIFTDEGKAKCLQDATAEVSAIALDEGYSNLGLEYAVDTESHTLSIDGGMEFLCLAWTEHEPGNGEGEDALTIETAETTGSGVEEDADTLTIGGVEEDADTLTIGGDEEAGSDSLTIGTEDGDGLSISGEMAGEGDADSLSIGSDGTDTLSIGQPEDGSISLEPGISQGEAGLAAALTQPVEDEAAIDAQETEAETADGQSEPTETVAPETTDGQDDISMGGDEAEPESGHEELSQDIGMENADDGTQAETDDESVDADISMEVDGESEALEEAEPDIGMAIEGTEEGGTDAEADGNAELAGLEEAESLHGPEYYSALEQLNKDDFTTARLVVVTDDASVIIHPENVIAQYGGIYLIQFATVEEAMDAYIHYAGCAQAVEPDAAIDAAEDADLSIGGEIVNESAADADALSVAQGSAEADAVPEGTAQETPATDAQGSTDQEAAVTEAAQETTGTDTTQGDSVTEEATAPTEDTQIEVTEDANPLAALSEEPAMNTDEVDAHQPLIALIDTGVSEGPNIVGRVSMIGDELVGNGHGDDMVGYIVSQNPDAQILSIRALDDDGRGTVSSIVAAMEYAIEQGVDIINLSLYAKNTLTTSVLESEIKKAVEAGITVVGAAGNSGDDAEGYMPGAVAEAYIIGACDDEGFKIPTSNYGMTVDYFVVGSTTSEAAAKFTGYISLHGMDLSGAVNLIYRDEEGDMAWDASGNAGIEGDDITIPTPTAAPPMSDEEMEEFMANYGLRFDDDFTICSGYKKYYWIYDPAVDYKGLNAECLLYEGETMSYYYGELSYDVKTDSFITYAVTRSDGSHRYLIIPFIAVEDRKMVPDESFSEEAKTMVHPGLTQRKWFTGQIPETIGAEIDGGTITVQKGSDFNINYITLGYDLSAFEVRPIDDGGFDVNVEGTYEALYEVRSYKDFDSWWNVKLTVNVTDINYSDGIQVTVRFPSIFCMINFTDGTTDVAYYGKDCATNKEIEFITVCDSDNRVRELVPGAELYIGDIELDTEPEFLDMGDSSFMAYIPNETEVSKIILYNKATDEYYGKGGGYECLGDDEFVAAGYTVAYQESFYMGPYVNSFQFYQDSDGYYDIAVLNINTTDLQTKINSLATAHSITLGDDTVPSTVWISCITPGAAAYDFSGMGAGSAITYTEYKDEYGNFAYISVYFKFMSVTCTNNQGLTPEGTTGRMYGHQRFAGSYQRSIVPLGSLRLTKLIYSSHDWLQLAMNSGAVGDTIKFTVYNNADMSQDHVAGTFRFKISELPDTPNYTTSGGTPYYAWTDAISGLDEGDYYIRETRSPTGFTNRDDEIWGPNHVTPGHTTEVTDEGKDFIVNDMYRFQTRIFKYEKQEDGTLGDRIKDDNAVFLLEYLSKNTSDNTVYWSGYFHTDANGRCQNSDDCYMESWTDSNGVKHESDDYISLSPKSYYQSEYMFFPIGRLRITEVQAPDGYKISEDASADNPIIINMTSTSGTTVDGNPAGKYDARHYVEVDVAEPLDNWYIAFNTVKLSDLSSDELAENDNYSVKGAVFGVYTDEACTNKIATLISGDDGTTNTETYELEGDVDSITLYCQEITPPAGHTLNSTKYPLTFTRTTDGASTTEKAIEKAKTFGEPGIENEHNSVKIKVKKSEKDGGWNDALKGAEFSLYKQDADGKEVYLESLTINENRFYEFKQDCKEGETYVIKETKTPAGYNTADNIRVQIGTGKNFKTGEGYYSYDVHNDMTPPTFHVEKKSNALPEVLALRGYSLKGAEFGLYTDAGCTDANLIATLVTDDNGITQTIDLPCDTAGTYTYYLKETKAPDGHLPYTEIVPITVKLPYSAGADLSKTIVEEHEYVDPGVFLKKIDGKGNPVGGAIVSMTYYDADGADESAKEKRTWYFISNDKGEVYFDEEQSKQTIQYGYESSEFYRNSNNKIMVPVGGYLVVKEVTAPALYKVSDQVFTWSTKIENLTETATLGVFELTPQFHVLEDELQPVKIRVQKYDENGKSPLAGVTFKLEFLKESIPSNGAESALLTKAYEPLLKQGESIEITTGDNGLALFENLDQGTYRISEIKTAEGHSLLKDTIEVTLPLVMSPADAAKVGKVDEDKVVVGYDDDQYYFFEVGYDITNGIVVNLMTGGSGGFTLGYVGIAAVATLGIWLAIMGTKKRKDSLKI